MNITNKTLDLHGIKHKDVPTIVDKFIGTHLMNNTYHIQIITGRSEKMKHLVSRVLDDYELYATDHVLNSGMLTVNLT